MKIIVCDDEKEYLESVKNILDNIAAEKEIVLQVEYFTEYETCREYAEKEKFDLAIIDMYLDDRLGIELAEELRRLQGNSFKLVFISAKNSYAAETYELNTSGYLLKPLDENLLKEAVLKCLN